MRIGRSRTTNNREATKTAFSLIEISIVILIVGVIIAGVVKSSALYTKYRVSTAANLTQGSSVHNIPDLILWYETTMENSFSSNEAQNYNDLESAETALGIGLIQTWYDIKKSGVRINATQTTLGKRPQFHLDCINSLPCLKFDGSNHYLVIPATFSPDNKEYSIFIVDKKDSTGTLPYLFFGPATSTTSQNDAIAIGYNSATKVIYSHGSTTDYYTATISSTTSPTMHSFIGAFDNSLLTTYISHRLYDSAPSTLTDAGTSSFDRTTDGNQYFIGAGYNGVTLTKYKGDIGEIIVFERALKASERKEVEEYLIKKWKLNG